MTSDQDPSTPAATAPAAVTEGAGAGGPAPAGSAPRHLTAAVYAAIALSALGLIVAITGPLWSPAIYGAPGSAQFMVLSVAQLRPALESDLPFRHQLTLVRGMLPSHPDVDQALETIAAYADKGVPTLRELRTSFVEAANAIVLQDVVGAEPSSFDRALISVAAALRLHALAHYLGGTWPASDTVWEAKTHLDAGDLAGASAALGRLTGPEAKAAEPWIRAAKSRIAANQVLELLDAVARSQAGISAQRS